MGRAGVGRAGVGRIKNRATFCALRQSGRRVRRGPVTVTFVGGGSQPGPRVAFAVSRRVGGAVERNRVRRRLRAIMWELGATLPAGGYLLGVSPAAAGLSFWELRSHVHQAMQVLADTRER